MIGPRARVAGGRSSLIAIVLRTVLTVAWACAMSMDMGREVLPARAAQGDPLPLGPPIGAGVGRLVLHGEYAAEYGLASPSPVAAIDGRSGLTWIASGSRVLAIDLRVSPARVVGRTPYLPGRIDRLATYDGGVIALLAGPPREAYLIDAKDPTWPRLVRRMELGGSVQQVHAHGSLVDLVVNGDFLRLDLGDPRRPMLSLRKPLTAFPDESELQAIAMDDQHVAVLSTHGRVTVHGHEEAPAEFLSQSSTRNAVAVALGGQGLFLSTNMGKDGISDEILAYRLTELGALAPIGRLTFGPNGQHGGRMRDWTVTQDGLAVSTVAKSDGSPLLTLFEAAAPDGAWQARREWSMPFQPRVIDATSKGQPFSLLLLAPGRLMALGPGLSAVRLDTDVSLPIPRPCFARVLARQDDLVCTDGEGVRRFDIRNAVAPRLISRIAAPTFINGEVGDVGLGTWHDGHLWIATREGGMVLDLSQAEGRVVATLPLPCCGEFHAHAGYVYSTSRTDLVVIDPDLDEGPRIVERTPMAGEARLSAGVRGSTLWLVITRDGSAPTLVGYSLTDPRRPRRIGALPLGPSSATSIALTSGGFAVLTMGALGNRLSVIDLSNPRAPTELANLDLESGPEAKAFKPGLVHPYGPDVLLTGPGHRLSLIDLDVPSLPKERYTRILPQHVRWLTANGQAVWLTGVGMQLVLRRPELPFEPRHTLWLPSALH